MVICVIQVDSNKWCQGQHAKLQLTCIDQDIEVELIIVNGLPLAGSESNWTDEKEIIQVTVTVINISLICNNCVFRTSVSFTFTTAALDDSMLKILIFRYWYIYVI